MDQPSVHLATVADLPWIRSLWRDMVTEAPPPYPTEIAGSIDAFTRSIALALTLSPPQAFVFLGQLPGSQTPDAFLAYEVQTRALGEPARIAFVHYCYTKPEARHHGLATTLAELASEHMAAQGLAEVEITHIPGEAAWADLGFVPYEIRAHAPVAGIAPAVARRRLAAANGHDPTFDVPPPLTPEDRDDDA